MQGEDALIAGVAQYADDPLRFVRFVFPWGEPGPLKDEAGPDEWQTTVLNEIRDAIRNGSNVSEAIRIAVASGHGIGKTALIAWIIIWFASTREYPQIQVTANTQAQLSSKTWRELSKWHRMALNKHWFQWTATKFYHVDYPDTWFALAIPWSEHNAEAFAGTHEKHVLVIYDEGSGIADKIWETTEGAMTTAGAIWIAFGNPTKTTGRFKECFGKFKHRWITHQIDSRTSKKANRAQIDQWVQDYGEDSDFVRIRVRGVFPRASSNQFIGQDLVDACKVYRAAAYDHLPKVLVLDVARFGDDQSVSGTRQGRRWKVKEKWRGLDTVTLANRFIDHIEEEDPDAIVIDGDGIGGGVIDILRARGYHKKNGRDIMHEFHGAGTPNHPEKYFNRRAEVWGEMRQAMKNGVQMDLDPELESDLTGPEYFFAARSGHDVIQLESKQDMKARGLSSPDTGDVFAMSYAVQLRDSARPKPDAPAVITVDVHDTADASQGWLGA